LSNQISAKVIAHSKAKNTGKEIITFELEFPRIVLAEFNTHNALSKNSSSSRAIPVQTMIQQVLDEPAMPVRFGKKNKGMQDSGEHDQEVVHVLVKENAEWEGVPYWGYSPKDAWKLAAKEASDWAEAFDKAGYAKQICNRLIEPFQRMKVVMTATELANFFWLRDHPAADPTIEALAKEIKRVFKESTPIELDVGDWHVPYFGGEGVGYWLKGCGILLQDALDISASCCAQVSYRKLDDSEEKAKSVVERLNLGIDVNEPMHVSPCEHQATPMIWPYGYFWMNAIKEFGEGVQYQEGTTALDQHGNFWSGNLMGWTQYRHLIPGNTYKGAF